MVEPSETIYIGNKRAGFIYLQEGLVPAICLKDACLSYVKLHCYDRRNGGVQHSANIALTGMKCRGSMAG